MTSNNDDEIISSKNFSNEYKKRLLAHNKQVNETVDEILDIFSENNKDLGVDAFYEALMVSVTLCRMIMLNDKHVSLPNIDFLNNSASLKAKELYNDYNPPPEEDEKVKKEK